MTSTCMLVLMVVSGQCLSLLVSPHLRPHAAALDPGCTGMHSTCHTPIAPTTQSHEPRRIGFSLFRYICALYCPFNRITIVTSCLYTRCQSGEIVQHHYHQMLESSVNHTSHLSIPSSISPPTSRSQILFSPASGSPHCAPRRATFRTSLCSPPAAPVS